MKELQLNARGNGNDNLNNKVQNEATLSLSTLKNQEQYSFEKLSVVEHKYTKYFIEHKYSK